MQSYFHKLQIFERKKFKDPKRYIKRFYEYYKMDKIQINFLDIYLDIFISLKQGFITHIKISKNVKKRLFIILLDPAKKKPSFIKN